MLKVEENLTKISAEANETLMKSLVRVALLKYYSLST